MDNQKNNKGVIALLIVIIVILSALCILFATGTISFNSNEANDDETNENINDTSNDKNVQTSNIKVEDIKEIFKVAYNYYELPIVYCGKSDHTIVNINGKARYASTEFTSYEAMLNSLKKYMSVEVIAGKTSWAATTKENYLEQDGKLYCEETYKGYMYGHGNIDIEINEQSENKVTCVATMELTDPSENKTYSKVNIVLEEKEGNWIITSYNKQN